MLNMNNAPYNGEIDLDFTKDLSSSPSDVPARQELTEIDAKILDVSNLINRLERDLQTPMDPNKGTALLAVLEKEKVRKMELLNEKFSAATPQRPKEVGVSFDEAMDANGGARISSRESKSENRQSL